MPLQRRRGTSQSPVAMTPYRATDGPTAETIREERVGRRVAG